MSSTLSGLLARATSRRGILVDSNVLIDVVTRDKQWARWSTHALAACLEVGPLILNPIIYAEISISFSSVEATDLALPPQIYQREPLPWAAGFLAGKSFLTYRQRGGSRTTPLPDFYIGAHAQVSNLAILSRDSARFRTYFPSVELLAPV